MIRHVARDARDAIAGFPPPIRAPDPRAPKDARVLQRLSTTIIRGTQITAQARLDTLTPSPAIPRTHRMGPDPFMALRYSEHILLIPIRTVENSIIELTYPDSGGLSDRTRGMTPSTPDSGRFSA